VNSELILFYTPSLHYITYRCLGLSRHEVVIVTGYEHVPARVLVCTEPSKPVSGRSLGPCTASNTSGVGVTKPTPQPWSTKTWLSRGPRGGAGKPAQTSAGEGVHPLNLFYINFCVGIRNFLTPGGKEKHDGPPGAAEHAEDTRTNSRRSESLRENVLATARRAAKNFCRN
jgi:hypothetical protein